MTIDDIMAGKAVIGSQRGTTGEMWVQDNLIATGKMPASNLKSFDNFPLAITALTNKQADATVYDKPPTVNIIEGQNVKIIYEIDTKEEEPASRSARRTPSALETMNKGLDQLRWPTRTGNVLKVKYQLVGA